MNLFCGCKNEGGTESSSIGNGNGGGGTQEKEGEDGEGDEQVDRGHGGAEIQRGRHQQQQAGRIVGNNLGQDLVENIIPANVDARGGPPAELGMNKAARGPITRGVGVVVEARVEAPLHRRGGGRVELEGRDGVEVGGSEDSTTDDDSSVSSLSSLDSEEISPEEINLQQRPSNMIDVVFESFMTSGNDENYIVREFASENFVRPDGNNMENFIQFGQLDEAAKVLTFTSYEDHVDARGCIRFGPPEGDGTVFNMFCCDLQILALSKPHSLSGISNTSPQEYFQSSASRVSSRVPQRTIPIESLGAAAASYPEPIPSLLNSLNAIVCDGSDMEKLVAKIVLEILKWLNNIQYYEYHVFGVNHGPFTVGKVGKIAVPSSGDDSEDEYNLPWSTTTAPQGRPRTIGRSVFLRSISNHAMHPNDSRLRRKLEVERNITSILLSKYETRFSSEIAENVLVNIEYNRMWYNSTYRDVQAEFALNTVAAAAASTSSGSGGTVADTTIKFIKFNDNSSVAYKHGKIHGCFKSGSTRLCMQLIFCSSGRFSDESSKYAEYDHDSFITNFESLGEASSENVNVAVLDGCNAAPFRSKDVPLCVKSVIDAVHGMMEEGQTMLWVAVRNLKFGRVVETASAAGAATRGQQFVESDSVYLYDQYYYVNVNTNRKLTESFNFESRDWIAAHSGILNSFVRVAPASSVLGAHIATDWTSSVQLLPLPAEGGEVSAPISIFGTSQPAFSTSVGDGIGKAMGCWITPTDPRSAHVIQFCVSLMMFYTSADVMASNFRDTILNGYDTLAHAQESTSGRSASSPVEQSLVLNQPFLQRLSECGRDISKCVGVVASQLFALVSERHSVTKQAVVGLYAETMKASILSMTTLTPADARRVSRYPQSAFFAKDYHGAANSENVIRHILLPPMYSAFHPNEANLAIAIAQVFLPTAMQSMSTNMIEAVQAMLVARNFLSNVTRSDSRGWIERSGGSTSQVVSTFEEKLDSPVDRITFRYNIRTLVGSINGCFDALDSGLRFCLVLQIFMKPHVSSASSDQAYTQSETPELAMDNLPANDGQTPVEDDVVHNYPSDLVRLSRSLEGTTHYIGDFIMNQLVYDWKSLVGGGWGNPFYIDSINIVGMKFGPYLNETHFLPDHFVQVPAFHIYRTGAPPRPAEEDD